MKISKTNLRLAVLARLALAGLIGATLILMPAALGGAYAADTAHLKIGSKAYGATQSLSLQINKSVIVDLPASASEVIVSQPAVAAVIMRTKTRAVIQGKAAGATNIFFLDGKGGTISLLDMDIYQQRTEVSGSLEAALARIIPGSHIRVESVASDAGTGHVVLTGTVQSQDDAQKAFVIAGQFAGDPGNVASVIQVLGSQQVKLKVTIAEVSRDTVKQLGINLNGSVTVGAVKLSLDSSQPSGGVSGVANSNGIGATISAPPFTLDASLKALERRGALRTLAEPTLTAISGQPAEFLVGGEFPYTTSDGNGHVVTAFKSYGVKLNFTPTVKSNGQIVLLVDTSVSEPAAGGGVTERSAKTTVQLPVGQTLGIAGMLQDSVRQQINSFPGLGNIPILGALFRSRDFIHSQSELVILVTPYLAEYTDQVALPTDGYDVAGDAEAIFLGHMEKMYGVGDGGMRGSYDGSVGFVLD